MQLSKNTVIELWGELANIPTVMNGDMQTVIDEDFLGWPAGTDVEEIWHFFDDQFADYGGVHVLMYEDPQPERKFRVYTPAGVIECYSKHEKDSDADFPGVYVDIRYTKKQLAEKQIGDLAAVVEYDSCTGNFQTVSYRPCQDEPASVEVYDREEEEPSDMTYGDFLSKYKNEIDCLDVYDENGEEITNLEDVPSKTVVLSFSRLSGCFDVALDYHNGGKPDDD